MNELLLLGFTVLFLALSLGLIEIIDGLREDKV